MFHKSPTRNSISRTLDIISLEDRLLFSVTGLVDASVVTEIVPLDAETPAHHANAPHAALSNNWQFSRSSQDVPAIAREMSQDAGNDAIDTSLDQRSLRGDFNRDGTINIDDIDMMGKMLQVDAFQPSYDLNSDGEINTLDLDVLIRDVIGTEYGDTNLDGRIDSVDAKTIMTHLFQPGGSWENGDMNFDGVVDGGDFLLWNAHKFETTPLGTLHPINVVPENGPGIPPINPVVPSAEYANLVPTLTPDEPTELEPLKPIIVDAPSTNLPPTADVARPEFRSEFDPSRFVQAKAEFITPTDLKIVDPGEATAVQNKQLVHVLPVDYSKSNEAAPVAETTETNAVLPQTDRKLLLAGSEFHRNNTHRVDVGVLVAKLRRQEATRV